MTFNVLKKPDVFYIGKQDENGAETIDIDYSAWIEQYGDGVITATFQGAEDASPYDIVLTTANGIATWTVTKANTAAAGVGKLQLNYIVNDVEAKSLIWTVRVYPSMRASGEAPDGYQDWLTALQGLSAETQQNAQNAAQSVSDAEDYADQAKASADSITGLTVEAETLPAGSSATASFDADTDKLSLGIPRGDKGEKGDTGQDGITPDLTIGTTETLPAGSSATATITGTKENPVLNLGIPQGIQGERGIKGDTGATPDISIGTVETLNPDESATATITGTAEDPVLNLGIPKGDTGSAGADGFSPSATVTKQDGNIVITVTDKDGTTSETLEVDNALDEDSVNPVQNAAIVEAMRSMLPVDTASGAIASFPDGADDVPMLSLKAQIEPVQDLHGYDSPWPAGGGKNKLPYATIENPLTRNGITFTRSQDGSIAVNGTSTGAFAQTFVEFALQPGSYYFNCGNGFSMQSNMYIYIRDVDNSRTLAEINTGNIGTDKAFSIDMQTNVRFYMVFGTTGLVISGTLYPMIRLASVTDATFAPYSNICPISGRTGVTVERTGANVGDEEWEVGAYTANGGKSVVTDRIRSKNAIPVLPNTTYYFKTGTTAQFMTKLFFDKNMAPLQTAVSQYQGNSNTPFTTPSDARYMLWYGSSSYGTTYNHDISINYPSTDHDYHPYSGQSINIQLGQTVYGGTLDVVSGELVIDRAGVDMGTLRWEKIGDRFYSTSINTIIRKGSASHGYGNLVCSQYVGANKSSLAQLGDVEMSVDSGGNLQLYDSRFSEYTPSETKAALGGVQLVYELAEPIEYTLSPQEVRTFLGQNNLWNDVGDTEVTYRADIQKYIEKKVNA